MANKPEILAPGGNFSKSIHALNSGADAVYIGLKSFSARKGATNFTFEELRSLKKFCIENSKKVYVAINTLIQDNEIPELLEILYQLEDIKVDAVIIQDLGLAHIIKENFNLEIHASTQLAVHNYHGVKFLKDYGFTRVVLSRELSFKEIKKIKEEIPDIELEIFIHGALCYGFSGLCLVSGKKLGRSANRGECGQICRTWFNSDGKKEFCFSLNDLFLSENIVKLKDIGVESLKIEGRMKSSSYVSTVSNHYKECLTGRISKQSSDNCHIEFSRNGSTGYFNGKNGGAKINQNYPGHIGLKIGEVIKLNNNSFIIKSSHKLNNRDGIMIFNKITGKENYKTSVNIIKKNNNLYTLKGSLPKGLNNEVFQISKHDNTLKEFKYTSYKPYKTPIDLLFTISQDKIVIESKNNKYEYLASIEEAKSQVDINKQLQKVFGAGGESGFSFNVNINHSFIPNPFLPNSILKQIKNQFLENFIINLSKEREVKSKSILKDNTFIQERTFKSYKSGIPFITDFSKITMEDLVTDDTVYLPLSPVIFDSKKYLKELKDFIIRNGSYNFIVGLNNVSHLEFIRELPDVQFYCDYGLYVTNRFTKSFITKFIPNVLWCTKWVEKDDSQETPPLFISRTCMKRKNGECPVGCTKKYSYTLTQNSYRYKVEVRDCMTYTFIGSESEE